METKATSVETVISTETPTTRVTPMTMATPTMTPREPRTETGTASGSGTGTRTSVVGTWTEAVTTTGGVAETTGEESTGELVGDGSGHVK